MKPDAAGHVERVMGGVRPACAVCVVVEAK